jgi:phenylacetate-CoA ligase
MPDGTYWNTEIETMPRERLEEIQVRLLRDLLDRASRNSPFYRDLYRKAGVNSADISLMTSGIYLFQTSTCIRMPTRQTT